jgi:pilus assembly protein CpaF
MLNNILIIVSFMALALILFMMYQKSKGQQEIIEEDDFGSIDKVVEAVKLEMVEIIKDDYSLGLTEAEFNALYKRKARIQEALRNCVYGIDSAKIIVIELIRTFIAENIPIETVEELLGLTEGQDPSDHIKFEIIMYKYKKKYGKGALAAWIDKNGFANERVSDAPGATNSDKAYFIDVEELYMSYEEEDIHLTADEKIDVLAVLVYQLYKGFGIVDTMREMDVNGFNMGTSGSILSNINKSKAGIMKATNAVWLYYQGKYIHMRFMNFGTEEELKRIIQLLVRWGNPGPLTAKRGYMVNTMFDKSRILALRPPASEYWAIFVRKFSLSDVSPQALIIKPYTNRGDLPVTLIEFLMRGQVTCGVTGRQGSGKTTLMSSIIRFIDPRYTIRVLEMAPELYLRELYPTRNILSVQETTTVTAAELQDALKKSDAAVSIVGEVATDIIAARMIQMGQVASIFTIFSHHANTPKDLVFALRNSLVNAGGFSNMSTAERQVIDVVKCDVHLDYTPDGKRYIERVSEIIPLPEGVPYPELDRNNLEYSKASLDREYYERSTDRVSFTSHDILKYNLDTHTYYVADRFSPALESRMRAVMEPDIRKAYDKFIFANWGRRKDSEYDEVAEAILEYQAEEARLAEEQAKRLEELKASGMSEEEAFAELNIVSEDDKVEIEESGSLEISNTDAVSDEDLEDAAIFFDFFDDGGV